jgi:O-6-methylguanine DNA methyltransferase
MRLRVEPHPSPIGTLLLVTDVEGRLCALDYPEYEARMLRLLARHHGSKELVSARPSPRLTRALEAYFHGTLSALDALPTATNGSRFQHTVWEALRAIPAGTTVSYGQLAAQLGRPTAARAVGLANGSNPIAIVVPCHRVIGANGTLTGYAGGVERKRWLLEHERAATRTETGAAQQPL